MIYPFVLITLLVMKFKVHLYEHEVPGPLSNQEFIQIVLRWFKSCTRYAHFECDRYRKQHDRRLSRPSRLLYFPIDQIEKVQLVEVQMDRTYQYATLSHRWGTPEPPKLSCNGDGHRKISYNTMIEGVSISDLPRVFREALQIIHHCKLEYLWIDSLCINQDNDNDDIKREWEQEAVKIGDIYTGGVFNIAAIGSKNSDGRLFPDEKEFFAPIVRDPFGPHGRYKKGSRLVGILADSKAEFEKEVLSSELFSRGWVYQEVILAPANLFCTAHQMWWLCHTGRYCQNHLVSPESGASLLISTNPNNPNDGTLTNGRRAIANPYGKPGSLELWGQLLRLYTKTSVTFEDDRLAAIAGLSKVFQSAFPECVEHDCYNSGFWSTNIVFQLSWHTTSSNVALNRCTADLCIPSWSPVSCKSEITYSLMSEDMFQLPIQCAMDTSGLDRFGRAKSIDQCILHLRGVPIEMTLGPAQSGKRFDYEVWPSSHPDSRCGVLWDNQAEVDLAAKASLANRLRALILFTSDLSRHSFAVEGIILRPFRDDDSTSPDKWVRCGYFGRWWPFHEHGQISGVFQLTRYGVTWVEVDSRWQRTSTGTAPDLEDVSLV